MPDPELPAELALHYDLERLNTLPVTGGYFDQPFTLMQDLRVVRKALRDWDISERVKDSNKDKYNRIAGKVQKDYE